MNWKLAVGTSIILGALGQVLLKIGVSYHCFQVISTSYLIQCRCWESLLYICAGITCYLIAVVCWIIGLRRKDLAYLYPFLSLGFILIFIASATIPALGESVSVSDVAGLVLIVIGFCIGCYAKFENSDEY